MGRWQSRQDRQATERVVARLFAFADLAERASVQLWFVRVWALWFLRSALSVAHGYVADSAGRAGLEHLLVEFEVDAPPEGSGFSAQAAIRIAFHFRALAIVLSHLAACESAESGDFSDPMMIWSAGSVAAQAMMIVGVCLAYRPDISRPEVRAGLSPGFT